MTKKLYHQFICSSLMLPEHRARLAQHRQNCAREICRERPAFTDEQQLEQFQRLLDESLHSGTALTVTFMESGRRRTFTGVVCGRQPEPDRLRFRLEGRMLAVPVAAIVYLEAGADCLRLPE